MIKTTIVGTDRVIAQLNAVGPRVRDSVRIAIRQLAVQLKGNVKRDKLSGQVLKRRTGNLSRSIDDAVVETPEGAVGIVSTNVKYGRAHEYGFQGAVTVKAHLRTIKMAWGKQITPTSVNVNSFTRNMNLPMRSFLRTALSDFQGTIQMKLTAAVNSALRSNGSIQ